MSLGGGFSTALNNAVNGAVDDGVVFVVSAGNSNTDACSQSPASATNAITVGSTTSSDVRSSFSNYGSCVDIFAPGSDILSAYIDNDSDTATLSGTSMASPHVTGAVALLLAKDTYNPNALQQWATKDAITNHGQDSPNALLYVGGPCTFSSDCTGGNSCITATCESSGFCSRPTNLDGSTSCDPVSPCHSGVCQAGYCANSELQEGNACLLLDTCSGMCDNAGQCIPSAPFAISLTTDNYPGETAWRLIDSSTSDVVVSSPEYDLGGHSFCNETTSLDAGDYVFEITDSYGDGICCDWGSGSYTVYSEGSEIASGGEFGSSETTTFNIAAETCSPPCISGEVCKNDVCVQCAVDSDCSNDFCEPETCDTASSTCQSGPPPDCGVFGCDTTSDKCFECVEDANCDDGLWWNGEETCSGGYCTPGIDPCPGQNCDEDNDRCICGDKAEGQRCRRNNQCESCICGNNRRCADFQP